MLNNSLIVDEVEVDIESLSQKVNNVILSITESMKLLSQKKQALKSPFPVHLAFGHERLAACIAAIRSKNDQFTLTHRNIHFNLALTPIENHSRIIDEALVKSEGINKGTYGCMTMRNEECGIVYTTSILGNNLSVGLGIASCLGKDNVCWIQTGDGAIEEGSFYEALLFASARSLRCVIVLENNNWSLGTSIQERRNSIDMRSLCQSVGVAYVALSQSQKTTEMLHALCQARSQALHGPVLVEAHVTTLGGRQDPVRGYVSYHHGPVEISDAN